MKPLIVCACIMLAAGSATASEITTNSTVVVPKQTQGAPLWGYADLHDHQFANLAYGGAVLWGYPYHEQGVERALAPCDYSWDFNVYLSDLGLSEGFGFEIIDWLFNDVPIPPFPLLHPDPYGIPIHGNKDHGIAGLNMQLLHGFTNNIAVEQDPFVHHDEGGYPSFAGWPHYDQGGHQQMYHKWLERAYQGGMRLLVNLAVNNAVLCELSFRRAGIECDDMTNHEDDANTVNRQIQGMKNLESYIDLQNDGLEDGDGWYRIAESASDARQIIEDGAMAVVIGIEVDSLFGCKSDGACTRAFIEEQLDEYYAMGVRHVFPVHFFDNQFTGGSFYNAMYAYANFFATGGAVQPWDCSVFGYDFKVEYDEFLDWIYNPLMALYGEPFFDPTFEAHCNARGITADGRFLVEKMIEKGFIIDIDHLSHHATNGFSDMVGVLDIVEDFDGTRGYTYPVVSGHAALRPNSKPKHEGSLTTDEATRVRNLGGIISAPMSRGRCESTRGFIESKDCDEAGNCARKGYHDLVDFMRKNMPDTHWDYPGIGLAPDFGAFNPQAGPRFRVSPTGLERICQGEADDEPRDAAENFLRYPFPSEEPGATGEFTFQKTGDRSFDFNFDGLAHVGLLPDFTADVITLVATDPTYIEHDPYTYLDPLFGSAEAYVRMWERIEHCTPDGDPPEVICPPGVAASSDGGAVAVDFSVRAQDEWFCDLHVADSLAVDPLPGSMFDLGSTEVVASATDAMGLSADCSFNVNVSTMNTHYLKIGWSCPQHVFIYMDYIGDVPAYVEVEGFGGFNVIPYDGTGGNYFSLVPPEGEVLPEVLEFTVYDNDVDMNLVATVSIDISCLTFSNNTDEYGGLFRISEFEWIPDDDTPDDEIIALGTMVFGGGFDPATMDVSFMVEDLYRRSEQIVIPAGSFVPDGEPEDQKYRYESPDGDTPGIVALLDFGNGQFDFRFTEVPGTDFFLGTEVVLYLQVGAGQDRSFMEDPVTCRRLRRYLEYGRNDFTPPVPDLETLPTVTGECSATVTTYPTATDDYIGQVVGTTDDPLEYTEQGTYTITWSYDDGVGNISTQTQTVIVDDVTPPVPDIEPLPVLSDECLVTVSTIPTSTDNCEGVLEATTADPLEYPDQGSYTITWWHDDGNGNQASQSQQVVVEDTTPPSIEQLTAVPDRLWPPNHKMRSVALEYAASDNCDAAPECRIVLVESNEAQTSDMEDDGFPDWEITGPLSTDLRAERFDWGTGRVYTITALCTDYAGQETQGQAQVTVPHDKRE